MVHVYVTPVEDKRDEQLSVLSKYIFARMFKIQTRSESLIWVTQCWSLKIEKPSMNCLLPSCYQPVIRLMHAIKHKPRVTQMIRFVLYILRCARCFIWGCPQWDRLLAFSRWRFFFFLFFKCTTYSESIGVLPESWEFSLFWRENSLELVGYVETVP